MTEDILFSRFKIIKELGRGGFGTVFQAFDIRMERNVAIKRIPKNVHTAPRAVREAKTVALLSHPNIVTVHDFIEDENYFYLVMERIDGIPFDDILKKNELTWEEAEAAALQVSSALECAHYNYVIHRDIKPANLLLLKDGRIKVLDFGIARLLGSSPVSYGEGAIGTLAYISPEQARDDIVDERSDLFALGVFMYESLTGDNPFKAETKNTILFKIQNHVPEHPSKVDPNIPEGVGDVVMKLLEKEPENRYDSVAEMRNKLLRHTGKLEEQQILKVLYEKHVSGLSELQQPEYSLLNLGKGFLNNIFGAVLAFLLILSAGRLTADGLSSWSIAIAAVAGIASIKLPKAGLLVFVLYLAAISFGHHFVLGVLAFITLALYLFLLRKQSALETLLPFSFTLIANAGFGLSFPLVAGFLTKPVNAFFTGVVGSFFLSINDILAAETIRFLSFKSPQLFYDTPSANTLITQPIVIFWENPSIIIQAIIIGIAAFFISVAKEKTHRFAPLYAAAVLIFILYGYRIITLMTSSGQAKDYEAAFKAWSSSLLLSVPALLIWSLFGYLKQIRGSYGKDAAVKRT